MSLRDRLMQLEKKRNYEHISVSQKFSQSVLCFADLLSAEGTRSLLDAKIPSKPAVLSGTGCFFADGMEVDMAPVVAGQFEDAEVDH